MAKIKCSGAYKLLNSKDSSIEFNKMKRLLEIDFSANSFLGSNLRPPVFRSYFENQQNSQNNNNNSEEIAELKKMIADLAKMQKMESSKKVVLNPHDVSSYQNEYNKQTEIATL